MKAAERFFRCYEAHSVRPDKDTMFHLLNAAHSFNDKLKREHNSDFFELPEFKAIKALRNLFHHEAELISEMRPINTREQPVIQSELAVLCLVPRSLVERAIEGIPEKRRVEDEAQVREVLRWYGNVVDLNPCLFNFAVHVYERLNELDLEMESESFKKFGESYMYEEEHGHSHFVSGNISCLAGDVNKILETAFRDVA